MPREPHLSNPKDCLEERVDCFLQEYLWYLVWACHAAASCVRSQWTSAQFRYLCSCRQYVDLAVPIWQRKFRFPHLLRCRIISRHVSFPAREDRGNPQLLWALWKPNTTSTIRVVTSWSCSIPSVNNIIPSYPPKILRLQRLQGTASWASSPLSILKWQSNRPPLAMTAQNLQVSYHTYLISNHLKVSKCWNSSVNDTFYQRPEAKALGIRCNSGLPRLCSCLQQSVLSLKDGIVRLALSNHCNDWQTHAIFWYILNFALASARFRAKMRTSNIHQ